MRSPHFLDIIFELAVLLAQVQIFRILRREICPVVRPQVFRALQIVVMAPWPLMVTGFVIGNYRAVTGVSMAASYRVIPELAALVWGFGTTAALILYLLLKPWILGQNLAVSEPRRKLLAQVTTASLAAPFAAIGYGMFIERTAFEVREVHLPVNGLPADFEGVRIAQISDLHVSPYFQLSELQRVVAMTNELQPFLTLVTGDLISYPGDPLDATIRILAGLRADHGILGCLGNHEIYCRAEAHAAKEAARYGMDFLRMQAKQVQRGNSQLNFAGVDFQPFQNRPGYLTGAEKLLRPGMPNLLLSHNPDVFPKAAKLGFDVTLAGHTHAGQITVEILNRYANVVRFLTPYVAGLYVENNKACYVNAGIGTIGMPVRLGAPPEITLFRLRRS